MTIGRIHFGSFLGRVLWLSLAMPLIILSFSGRAPAQEAKAGEYVSADAIVTGKEMYSFSADGEMVDVVRGDFSLAIGKRTLSGANAVLWIKERRVGQQTLRDIEVYIEGKAANRVTDFTLRHRGLLHARVGRHEQRNVESLPLFKRAQKMRLGRAGGEETKPVEGARPPARPRRTTRPAARPCGNTHR